MLTAFIHDTPVVKLITPSRMSIRLLSASVIDNYKIIMFNNILRKVQGCQPCETKNREIVVQKSGEIFRIIKLRFLMYNWHTVSFKFQFYEFGD
jgi:hypothetical protein